MSNNADAKNCGAVIVGFDSSIEKGKMVDAISKYDDTYMAQRFSEYFKLLSKDATTPKLLEDMRVRSNR